ncbi:hypothetical protein [Thermobifida alba]|nr:hypothetical protein [Thermobifida alba]
MPVTCPMLDLSPTSAPHADEARLVLAAAPVPEGLSGGGSSG